MNLSLLVPQKKYTTADYFNMMKNLLPKGVIWEIFLGSQKSVFWKDNISGTAGVEVKSDTVGLTTVYQDNISTPLKPEGQAWLAELVYVFALELDRWYGRYLVLAKETVPGLSTELLPAWEKLLGLPDPTTPATTDDERRMVAHEKYTSGKGDATVNGMNRNDQYFIDYAAYLGYSITISYFTSAFRVGMRIGSRLHGFSNAHQWIITGSYDSILQGVFDRIKPAHTTIIWN